ncbi:hypothetical protein [Spongiactinospora rosea]|nr:hypothetical protein [Spongiactinospora rosea]
MTYLVELPVEGAGGRVAVVKVQVGHVEDGLVKVARPGRRAGHTLTG